MNLEQSLRELAQDDAAAQVPAHVDAAVMAAWDAAVRDGRERAVPGRRARLAWIVAGVAAVGVLVIAASILTRAGSASASAKAAADRSRAPAYVRETPLAGSASRNPAYGTGESVGRVPTERYVGRIPRSGPATAVRARTRPIAPPPIDAGYVLVPGTMSDSASLTLMRVRMPRSAFSSLGVPIANPDADGLVDVEVLVGEDGVARSIRRAAAVGWSETN